MRHALWCSRHNSCHHFSVNHLVQTSVHYTSSLFINYTYMLYTCHCILHHNTSILKQFKVLLWMLRLCITVPYMYHYTSLCKQVTQASLSTSRAVIYHPNCSYSAAASTIGILTALTAVQTVCTFLFIYCSCPHQTAASVKHCFTAAPKRLKN